jgi:coenzyme Q-binding protein COQ10
LSGGAIHRQWQLRIEAGDVGSVFAVVSDVERYEEFLPGVGSARIVERGPNHWLVDNTFGFGPLQDPFRSRADFDPPHDLTIGSNNGPWRNLRIHWQVRQDGAACVLSCDATLEFRSGLLAALARVTVAQAERRIKAAFESRIKRIAGHAATGRSSLAQPL